LPDKPTKITGRILLVALFQGDDGTPYIVTNKSIAKHIQELCKATIDAAAEAGLLTELVNAIEACCESATAESPVTGEEKTIVPPGQQLRPEDRSLR
jgi:hypothetical protein